MTDRHTTPAPGTQAPNLSFRRIGGGTFDLRDSSPENFTVVVFYRGVHCPICKKQIEELNGKIGEFRDKGMGVVAVSMDEKDRAERQRAEWDIGEVDIGYGLPEETARAYGLFISNKEKDAEPEKFSEPGIAVVKPDGTLYALYVQNTPFGRVQLDGLLSGLKFVADNDYPVRGTAGAGGFDREAAE